MEYVFIPVHILCIDCQLIPVTGHHRILFTAEPFRQMEQVHQIPGSPLLIRYGHILNGYRRTAQGFYDHLRSHVSPCKIPVGIGLVVPGIVPVGIKIFPGVQHRDTGVFTEILFQLGRPVPLPYAAVAIRHVFPVNAFFIRRYHYDKRDPPALIIICRPYDLIPDPCNIIRIKGLRAQRIVQAHASCKKIPAVFSSDHILVIRISEQL